MEGVSYAVTNLKDIVGDLHIVALLITAFVLTLVTCYKLIKRSLDD